MNRHCCFQRTWCAAMPLWTSLETSFSKHKQLLRHKTMTGMAFCLKPCSSSSLAWPQTVTVARHSARFYSLSMIFAAKHMLIGRQLWKLGASCPFTQSCARHWNS
jgi:hypothetical protein